MKGEKDMLLGELVEIGFVNDETMVSICDNPVAPCAKGVWYEDNVLRYLSREVECFTVDFSHNCVHVSVI